MIGQTLGGRYEIRHLLGSDPVFEIYLALHLPTNRHAILRIVKPESASESDLIQSLKEAKDDLSGISHPAVEKLIEMEEIDGVWMIASETHEGTLLETRLDRIGTYSLPVALSTMVGIVEAMAACHKAGLIHGDISNRTAFVNRDETIRLLLPGFWKCYAESPQAARAYVPLIAPYLAPEITSGQMPSASTDIYSAGVLLYQLLTGNTPYEGDTPTAQAKAHATIAAPSVSSARSSVPAAVDELIKKCMAKSAEDRYASAEELLKDLRIVQDALRFGRSLTWPLEEGPTEDEAAPVAPVFDQEEDEERRRKIISERKKASGVPVWISGMGLLALAGVLLTVGFWLYDNIKAPKELIVPDLRGMSLVEAADELRAMGLQLRKNREEPSDQPKGTLISLSPSAGRTVREGAVVFAVVSAGSKFVEAPDLVGKTIDEAKSILDTVGLDLYEPVEYVSSGSVEKGRIVSQTPDVKSSLQRSSKVRVKVSQGRSTSRPDVYDFRFTVRPDITAETTIRIDMEDGIDTRTVHEGHYAPGTAFEVIAQGFGPKATFIFFFNNQEIKRQTVEAAEGPEEVPEDIAEPAIPPVEDPDEENDEDGDTDETTDESGEDSGDAATEEEGQSGNSLEEEEQTGDDDTGEAETEEEGEGDGDQADGDDDTGDAGDNGDEDDQTN